MIRSCRCVLATFVACALLVACRDVTTNLVSDPLALRDGGAGAKPDSGATPAADAALPRARCHDALCACDDGLDNDDDGLPDGLDPECTGAFDDDEKSFATGVPRSPGICSDCYWDDNGGRADDGCLYPRDCSTGKVSPPGRSNCGDGSCTVSTGCVSACVPRTPNGCDCFGCCTVLRDDGTSVDVLLEDHCALDKLDDDKACPRCKRSTQCQNPCGHCELCPGRTADELPSDCTMTAPIGSVEWTCENAKTCQTSDDCGADWYCQQGCCLPVVL